MSEARRSPGTRNGASSSLRRGGCRGERRRPRQGRRGWGAESLAPPGPSAAPRPGDEEPVVKFRIVNQCLRAAPDTPTAWGRRAVRGDRGPACYPELPTSHVCARASSTPKTLSALGIFITLLPQLCSVLPHRLKPAVLFPGLETPLFLVFLNVEQTCCSLRRKYRFCSACRLGVLMVRQARV